MFTTTDWNTPQEVTVTADEDDDGHDDSHPIQHAVDTGSAPKYLGVSVDSVQVTVDDDDEDGVSIPGSSLGTIDRRRHDILPSET